MSINEFSVVKPTHKQVTRRVFLKTLLGITATGASVLPAKLLFAEEVPPEPENLDEPTPWQEGDPQPRQMEIPPIEPEQQSEEDPPSQPMDDERGDPPSPDHKWVYGYWWWTNGEYVWVPGYWEVPPKADYEYEPGYWKHGHNPWIFVRGGWVVMGTTIIVASASPRPVLTAWVISAPRRIRRRHRRWAHYRTRRRRHTPKPGRTPRPGHRPAPRPTPRPSPGPSPGRSPGKPPKRQPGGRPGGPVKTN